jgi:hypothetical protein
MRLVRSGEDVDSGEVVALPRLFELARRWYGDRLSPDWRPRTVAESQRILSEAGLVGDFWRLG